MKETINGKTYELISPNVCTGCNFFDGDEGCNLPDEAEIGCDVDTIYVEVKQAKEVMNETA